MNFYSLCLRNFRLDERCLRRGIGPDAVLYGRFIQGKEWDGFLLCETELFKRIVGNTPDFKAGLCRKGQDTVGASRISVIGGADTSGITGKGIFPGEK